MPTNTTGDGKFDWGSIIGALIGAYSGRQQAQAANRPTTTTTNQTTNPWAPSQPFLNDVLQQSFLAYRSNPNMPAPLGNAMSDQTRGLLNSIIGQGLAPPRVGSGQLGVHRDAQNFLSNMYKDPAGWNPYAQSLEEDLRANRYLDEGDAMYRGVYDDARYAANNQGGYDLTRGDYDLTRGEYGAGGSGGGYFDQIMRGGIDLNSIFKAAGIGTGGGGGGGGGSWAGTLPNGLFDQHIKQYLDPTDTGQVDALVEKMRGELLQDHQRSIGDLNNEMNSRGRLGSSFYQQARGIASDEFGDSLAAQVAAARLNDLQNKRATGLQALGLVNDRDAAAMAASANASAGRAAAAAASDAQKMAMIGNLMQYDLGMRGLDIDEMTGMRGLDIQEMLGMRGLDNDSRKLALGAAEGLSGNRQFGLGLRGNLANSLGNNMLQGVQLSQGFKAPNPMAGFNARMNGLQTALQASGMLDAANFDAQNRMREYQMQQAMTPYSQLDDYWRRITGIAGLGGQSAGQNTVPGAGLNVNAAMLAGMLGGAGVGWGLGQNWRDAGNPTLGANQQNNQQQPPAGGGGGGRGAGSDNWLW